MLVTLVHGVSGSTKQVKLGFSWTTLFFGCLPALFRGDLKWALIMFICNLVTCGISLIIFPFFYNKSYVKDLLEKGYKPADDAAYHVLKDKGIVA